MYILKQFVLVMGIVAVLFMESSLHASDQFLSLAGTWHVALDRDDVGSKEKPNGSAFRCFGIWKATFFAGK